MLDENGVYYKQQVTIDKCGIIVGLTKESADASFWIL
jgi:hypothetical protein